MTYAHTSPPQLSCRGDLSQIVCDFRGRRPNSTLTWNFFNSFREAQCPETTVGEYLEQVKSIIFSTQYISLSNDLHHNLISREISERLLALARGVQIANWTQEDGQRSGG